MYSNHPPSSSRRSPYEYPQGYDSSQPWPAASSSSSSTTTTTPTTANHVPGQGKQPPPTPTSYAPATTSYPSRFASNDPESHEEGNKSFSNRSDYWYDHPPNSYSPPAHGHWPTAPVYPSQQQQPQRPTPHTQSPLQLPPTPSSTSSSTEISPHGDGAKPPQSGYPFPVTFQQQPAAQHNQPHPGNHRTPHWRIPVTERPFKCDNCPLSFNRNHDLKRHARIHLSVKPFPCYYCDKRFSRKDALKRHMLVKRCGQAQAAAQAKSTGTGTGNANGHGHGHSSGSGPTSSSSYYDRQGTSPQPDSNSNYASSLFLPPPSAIQNRTASSSSLLHHHHHGLSNDASSAQSTYPI